MRRKTVVNLDNENKTLEVTNIELFNQIKSLQDHIKPKKLSGLKEKINCSKT